MTPNFGIYQAVVTDNTQFFTNGKIKVRVQNMYNGKMDWDLTQNFDYNEFIKEISEDLWCLVATPIGGGSNHGLFSLPQINSVGLVQFMNGNIKKPIWMGSFFRPEYNQNGKLTRVNVPNDQKEYEGSGADGITQNENNIGEKRIEGDYGTLILRTKSTSGPTKYNNGDEMNFNEQDSENLVILSKDKLNITHFSEWDRSGDNPVIKKWQEIEFFTNLDGDPEVNIKVSDIDNRDNLKETSLVITNNEVALKVSDEKEKMESSIGSTSDGINITSRNTDNDNQTSITQSPRESLLLNKEVSINLWGDEASISVPNGKLRLSGQEVLLGDGGGYVVVKDDPLPARMEDGTILKASKVKA